MTDKPNLRRRALLNQGYKESINSLLRITAPHEWIIGFSLAIALICGLAWGVFGRVELNVTTEGVIVYPGSRNTVATAVNGRVTKILIEPGQKVAEGTPIVSINPAESDMQMRIAREREQILDELIEESDSVNDAVLQAALTNLRVENAELTALRRAGSIVVAPEAGVVTAVNVNVGDSVLAGAVVAEFRHEVSEPLTAAAFMAAKQLQGVTPGLAARVTILADDEATIELSGKVEHISGFGELPTWLRTSPIATSNAATENFGRLVTLALENANELQVEDLKHCTVEIALERLRPLSLLLSSQGGT